MELEVIFTLRLTQGSLKTVFTWKTERKHATQRDALKVSGDI